MENGKPTRERITSLLSKLIRIRSVVEPRDMVSAVETYLEELEPEPDIKTPSYSENGGDFKSVLAEYDNNKKETLFLESHMDVVPAEDWEQAWKPEVKGDKLIGRGASDTKGGMAGTLIALKLMSKLKRKYGDKVFGKNILFAAPANEETGVRYASARRLINQLDADNNTFGIVNEPTLLGNSVHLGIGNRGVLDLRVETNLLHDYVSLKEMCTFFYRYFEERVIKGVEDSTVPIDFGEKAEETTKEITSLGLVGPSNVTPTSCEIHLKLDLDEEDEGTEESLESKIEELISSVNRNSDETGLFEKVKANVEVDGDEIWVTTETDKATHTGEIKTRSAVRDAIIVLFLLSENFLSGLEVLGVRFRDEELDISDFIAEASVRVGVLEDVEELKEEVKKAAKGLEKIQVESRLSPTYSIDRGEQVNHLQKCIEEVYGSCEVGYMTYWTDAAYYAKKFPCVIFGPGNESLHEKGEWVSISAIEKYIKVLLMQAIEKDYWDEIFDYLEI